MLRITLVLFIVGEAVAQVPFRGACPALKTVKNFDLAGYMGKWYEAAKYFLSSALAGKCATDTYTLGKNGSFHIKHSRISTITGEKSNINAIATPIGKPGDAKFIITFPSLSVDIHEAYWVLETDYHNWAVAWSCENSGKLSYRQSWILTRKRNAPPAVLKTAHDAVGKRNISGIFFLPMDQNNCS